MSVSLSDPEQDFQPPTPSGLDLATNPVVTFLSPISSPSKIPSNPASPDETPASLKEPTNNPTTTIPDVTSFLRTGLQLPNSLPENDQSKTSEELPPFSSLLSDVRPLLSRQNYLTFQPDQSALGRQHHREYYTDHARRTKRPRFNQQLPNSLKREFSAWKKIFRKSRRQEHTIQSKSLRSQRLVVPPQAITAFSR